MLVALISSDSEDGFLADSCLAADQVIFDGSISRHSLQKHLTFDDITISIETCAARKYTLVRKYFTHRHARTVLRADS